MAQKSVAKFKQKSPCGLKNDIRSLVNFHVSSWKSENLDFDWIRLSKAYKYLDKKVQKSYLSWHWRVIQSLKKNWLLVPKMTWGIWWILMRAVANLEICTLMYYFCQQHIKFLPKKCGIIISHGTEKDLNFEEKLTFYLKNDMRNLVNSAVENLHLDGLLLWKVCNVWANKDTEELCCEKWLMFSKMTLVVWWFYTQVVESNVR